MHCEITDRYFNIFLDEIQLKKENLKSLFGCQSLGTQNHIPVTQTAWICHCILFATLNMLHLWSSLHIIFPNFSFLLYILPGKLPSYFLFFALRYFSLLAFPCFPSFHSLFSSITLLSSFHYLCLAGCLYVAVLIVNKLSQNNLQCLFYV